VEDDRLHGGRAPTRGGDPDDAPPPVVRDAYVYADREDASRVVAGVPQLVRTLLALQCAGVERCVLVGDAPPPRDPRLRLVVVVDRDPVPPTDDAPTFVVGSDTVVDRALLAWLGAQGGDGRVADLQAGRARVRVAPARRALPLLPLTRDAAPRVGTLCDADHPEVASRLIAGLANDRDGYLDRLLHRPLSRPVSLRLLGATPNAVTAAGIAIGVLGGAMLGLPGPAAVVLAVVALVASGVLDCVDGELARVGFAESKLGHVLDVGGDTVVHVAVLGGIAMRLGAEGVAVGSGTLWLLALGVLGSFGAITWSEATEARRHRVACWENRILDRVLSPLTTRDWYVFPVVFAAAGRLDLLVVGAALGAHLFWPLVAWLVWRVLAAEAATPRSVPA
jgi:phosphatidylglycerophosphate synthase